MGCGASAPETPGKTVGAGYAVSAAAAREPSHAPSDAGKPAAPTKTPPASPAPRSGDARQSHATVGDITVPAGAEETGCGSPVGRRMIPVLKLEDQLFQRVRKCLYAQDKMEISVSTGYQQFFNLSTDIFQEDTEHNTKEQLAALKTSLFAETELCKPFVTLFSSPLNTVNLDDKSRERGAIPKTATFFSFCNPCAVNTVHTRAALALDIQMGRNARTSTAGEYLELDPATSPRLGFPRGYGESGFLTPVAGKAPTLLTPMVSQTAPSSRVRADEQQFETGGADAVRCVQEHQQSRMQHSLSGLSGAPIEGSDVPLDMDDPLVRWLLEGAFMYFDHKYDIVGINAVHLQQPPPSKTMQSARPRASAQSSAIYLGKECEMQQESVQTLKRCGRWWPVTAELSQVIDVGAGDESAEGRREKGDGDEDEITHFAWILPSECLGSFIFTKAGGFAYKCRDDTGKYFPVVGKRDAALECGERPAKFEPSCHILNFWKDEQLAAGTSGLHSAQSLCANLGQSLAQSDPSAEPALQSSGQENKYWSSGCPAAGAMVLAPSPQSGKKKKGLKHAQPIQLPAEEAEEMEFSEGQLAAVGMESLLLHGWDADAEFDDIHFLTKFAKFVKEHDAVHAGNCVLAEIAEAMKMDPETDPDKCKELEAALTAEGDGFKTFEEMANYVVKEEASEVKLLSAATGMCYTRDKNRTGWTLRHFHQHRNAREANLTLAEVAAVRVYTTACYKLINLPLRRIVKERQASRTDHSIPCKRHPLPFTTYLLYRAVKKLRACNLHKFDTRAYSRYLWRGVRDLQISKEFEEVGGTHAACMSTSKSLEVVKHFCQSKTPLLFRIKVESPMEFGADISWISTVPEEEEVLYPPLTYLRPVSVQSLNIESGATHRGKVVLVKPSFPS